MEGTIYDRRVLHRPTKRPVASRSNTLKPIPKPANPVTPAKPIAAAPSPAPASAAVASKPVAKPAPAVQEVFSKLTPIYVPTPLGSASKVRAKHRGMDWVQHVTKKKVHHEPIAEAVSVAVQPKVIEVPAETPVEQAVEVELQTEAEVETDPIEAVAPESQVDIAAQIAAELAQALPISAALDPLPTNQRSDEELTPSPSHSLSNHQRDVLQRQFQQALATDAKHGQHSAARRRVVERVKHHAKKAKSPRTIVAVFLLGVVLSGLYATIDSFNINQQARQALAEQAAEAKAATKTSTPTTPTSTSSSSQQVPNNASTTPTTKTAATYTVAPDLPRFIIIPKLGIDAPVVSVGLTSSGAIDTPTNIYEAAWYNGSAKPGDNGATFIDGHSSASGGALFGHLGSLVNGDTIQIQKGDGTMLTYKVVKVAIVNRNDVDMASILKPYGDASKALNLITCDGAWVNSEETLTNRVLVWTEQV